MPPEAVIGEILVRFGMALAGIVLGIWAHFRISAESRQRMSLPDSIVADLKGLKHQVAELDETFLRHIKRQGAREGREAQRVAVEVPVPLAPALGPVAPLVVPNVVPPDLWRTMGAGLRAKLKAAGIRPGANGPATPVG